jgi:hypothetical protein
MQPRRLLVPYYVCDAVTAPALAMGIPVVFYAIDRTLSPCLPARADGDVVLVVDYFGLCGEVVETLAARGEPIVVDQSHALFARAPEKTWRFTSVRKWFGVPDGGFAWGPERLPAPALRTLSSVPQHLVERVWGDAGVAYRAYTEAEASFDAEVSGISSASVALLQGVDVERVATARRRNFELLHARLEEHSALQLVPRPGDVPFCYPLLPRDGATLSRAALASQGLFVPQFWADCVDRADATFAWELDLSRRLLPLPIDHRYESEQMQHMADRILQLIHEGSP